MTKIEQKIIHLLSNYPEREFYGQEIANKIKCSKASVSGLLKSLLGKKIISKTTKGRMGFYQINQSSLTVKKLRINLALENVKPIAKKLSLVSQRAILFGSACRGEQTEKSDLDLFIIGKQKEEILTIIDKYRDRLNLQVIIKSPNEWSEMEIKESEFFREIKSGITIS